MTQNEYKKQLIKLIQINKKNVFEEDEDRKAFINSRFGVDSTKKLSIDQLKLLLDFCKRNVSDIPMLHPVENKEFVTELQKEKIRVLWNEKARNKSEEALLNFVFKITKAKIILLDDLLKGKATKVIVALERM
ncbi:MAG: hypothetical protein C0625_15420 [Arcobacter sp.]|nr:MAG: hypothetical protein C0625_15420 [Arcobacter sp.]